MPSSLMARDVMSPCPNREGLSESPTTSLGERQEVLSLEKGFWRVQHGAQELLRFSDIYRKSRAERHAPQAEELPDKIDLVAMTQLSWGVLQAVGDIKTHQRRVEELEALWRKDRNSSGRSRSSSKVFSLYLTCFLTQS
ncbi:hypothetical protein DL546_007309 [Coniochaeta pulveracea]|uniref:Uncharacterized protein n=1 Tax=Coniochaeta pulveracea TaxID=177199 RepID=A0A420YL12_9PEZI|nr:hypothetical protein DL546_007309 [Coniochaeta pulveracea]